MQCTFATEMCHHFYVCECKLCVCVCVLVSLESTLFARRKEYKNKTPTVPQRQVLFVCVASFGSIASTNVGCIMCRICRLFMFSFRCCLQYASVFWHLMLLVLLLPAARETTSTRTLYPFCRVIHFWSCLCVFGSKQKHSMYTHHAIPLRIFSVFLARSMRIQRKASNVHANALSKGSTDFLPCTFPWVITTNVEYFVPNAFKSVSKSWSSFNRHDDQF